MVTDRVELAALVRTRVDVYGNTARCETTDESEQRKKTVDMYVLL